MITLPFLLLALSPFVIFDSDYALILCLLCKSNTLWNSRNVEQDETACHVQELQLWLSYFCSYLPVLFEFDFVSALNTNTLRKCNTG